MTEYVRLIPLFSNSVKTLLDLVLMHHVSNKTETILDPVSIKVANNSHHTDDQERIQRGMGDASLSGKS